MIGLLILLLAVYFYYIPSKRYIAIILVFALLTAGFQLVPLSLMLFPGITKSYDWMYVFTGIIVFFKPGIFLDRFVMYYNRFVILFIFVLLALLMHSIMYVHVETTIAIRVVRLLFNFIFLFLFVPIEIDEYRKIFKVFVYLTAVAAFLYCLQPFLKKQLINSLINDEALAIEESGLKRYFNYPVFLFPAIFFFFFAKEEFKIRFHYVIGAIIFACILLTQFRNFLVAMLVCFLVNLYLQGKLKVGSVVVYGMLGLSAFFMVDNALDNRFSKGFSDLSKGSFSTKEAAVYSITAMDLHRLSTSEFRWYHFMERAHYVIKDPSKLWFGIGLANEDSKITKKLSFIVGTTNEQDNTNVPQIDTGDITWSLLLLQIGLVGIIFFLIAHLSIVANFFAHKEDPLMKIGLLFSVSLFISSLYMIDIVQPYNICLLMLFSGYAYHLKIAKEEQANKVEPAI